MISEAQVVITNPTGLHARPAVKLAQLAAGFDAEVQVRVGDEGDWVRARSTARVMKLKAGAQSVIHFRADGEQADDAVSALVDFVRRDFDEGPGATVAQGQEPEACAQPAPAARAGERALVAEVASRGLAVGAVHRLAEPRGARGPGADPKAEGDVLDATLAQAVDELHALAEGAGELAADLVEFQVSLLRDEEFIAPVRAAIAGGAPTHAAWLDHLASEIADYESAESAYLRDRAADLRDLRERVTMALTGAERDRTVPAGAIVVADELTPSRFLELDWSRAAGAATTGGSVASHAAMLARARGVPLLVGVAAEDAALTDGMPAIVDAERGSLIVEPSADTLATYERRVAARRERAAEALRHAAGPARTSAGTRVTVLVNVDDPALVDAVDASHCDGIGLARTEFLFHGRHALPDEDTQLAFYLRLLEWTQGRPVTVRTLDAGGDKPVAGLTLENESNPFLGLRGVRLSLARPEVLRVQLRALARAASHGELKVMVPMISVPAELEAVRRILAEEVERLRAAGVAARIPALGMMVEVPAAALDIGAFDADFFSLGTNDLTSYLLAAARDSAATASLLDPLHPAVLELVNRVAAHGTAVGREVSVCGEMAADPRCLGPLLDAGVRTLSVPPAALAPTKAALAEL